MEAVKPANVAVGGGPQSPEEFLKAAEGIAVGEQDQADFCKLLDSVDGMFGAEEELDAKAGEDEEEEVAKMKDAADAGFKADCPLGQAFARDLKKESQQKQGMYKAMDRLGKARERKSWARVKFETMSSEKIKEKKFVRSDVTEGQWYSFGALVLKYGGWTWAPAVQGAKNTATQCRIMGSKWSKVDRVSRLPMFWVLDEKHVDAFHKAWASIDKYQCPAQENPSREKADKTEPLPSSASTSSAASVNAVQQPASQKAIPTVSTATLFQEKAAKKTQEDAPKDIAAKPAGEPTAAVVEEKKGDDPQKPKTPEKTTKNEHVAKAMKLKPRLATARSTGANLLAQIQSGQEAYKILNHANAYGPLEANLANLNTKLSCFGETFLIRDAQVLKKERSEGDFLSGCEEFAKLESLVENVEGNNKVLLQLLNTANAAKKEKPKAKAKAKAPKAPKAQKEQSET